MLRVAVPNKGSLSETASQMLTEAGYSLRRDPRKLVHIDQGNEIEFFYLRPRDIATYVAAGTLDVGITGRDLLMDSGTEAQEILDLNFAHSTFRFAAPVGTMKTVEDLQGKRIATSYQTLLANVLKDRGVEARIVPLEGAVETAPRLGVADAIADVVSTGNTIQQAGLEIFGDTILASTAILIARPEHKQNESCPQIERLVQRLEGIRLARSYMMLEYDLPVSALKQATMIASGIAGPTVMPIARQDWVAVRVMVPSEKVAPVMDQLHALGAQAIVVTKIHAARM